MPMLVLAALFHSGFWCAPCSADGTRAEVTLTSQTNLRRPSPAELFALVTFYVDAAEPQSAAADLAGDLVAQSPAPATSLTSVTIVPEFGRDIAPDIEIGALEPDFSVEGLRRRFTVFVAQAIHVARASAPAMKLPPADTWTEKVVRFVWRAQQQARRDVALRDDGAVAHLGQEQSRQNAAHEQYFQPGATR